MRFARRLGPVTLVMAVLAWPAPAQADSIGLHSENYSLTPTSPGKWGDPAKGVPGTTITWSLTPSGISNAAEAASLSTALADFMPWGFLTVIEAAFAAWEAVAHVRFLMVVDSGDPFNSIGSTGDIRLGGHTFDGVGGTLAHGFFPPVNGASGAGDIHFDIDEPWVIGFDGPGFDFFQVLAHEIGHSLGLDHTTVPNSLMNPFYTEAFSGPQADDIAGMQFLYGPPETAAIPEPASLLLLGTGVVALVIAARRRRRTRR